MISVVPNKLAANSKKERKKDIYHIQNVNNYHQRLKGWLTRFKGVSTKFLNNYLQLFEYLDFQGFQDDLKSIRDFFVLSCIGKKKDTFVSIRKTECQFRLETILTRKKKPKHSLASEFVQISIES